MNSEDEPLLSSYFVPPPYFATVMGDTAHPHSNVVFAPRGGGKTAQRLMIELQSETVNFLCITYDLTELPPEASLDGANWEFHISHICRRILLAILVAIEEDRFQVELLDLVQRALLVDLVRKHLGTLSEQEFKWGLAAVKTFGDKASDIWRKYGGVIALTISALMAKVGLGAQSLEGIQGSLALRDDSLRNNFERLVEIVRSLGFTSLYVLVDKVDESSLTRGDARRSFDYVKALLTDLPTLETRGVAFKFFLWDQLAPMLATEGGRPDRIPQVMLHWTQDELKQMLSQRLSTYSSGAVTSLNQMLCPDSVVDLDTLAVYMGAVSPRNVIRFAGAVASEATRVGPVSCISDGAVWSAVSQFAKDISAEIAASYISDIRRARRVSFTINYLANDVFRTTSQAAGNKVRAWENAGLVKRIGEVPSPGNRPMLLFAISDIRIAITAIPEFAPVALIDVYAKVCPNCGALLITQEATVICSSCGSDFSVETLQSLLDVCSR